MSRAGLDAATIDAFDREGCTRWFAPPAVGGRSVDFEAYVEAIAAVAEIDPSTAWVLNIVTVSNWLISGLFDDSTLAELFPVGGRSVVTGSMVMRRGCQARRHGDELVVSGTWGFVSGCEHADWIFVKVPTPPPVPVGDSPHLIVLLRRDDLRLIDDWNYIGLEGTGSRTVVADEAVVPARRAAPFTDRSLEMGAPPARSRGLTQDSIPSRAMMRCPITAVAVGAARTALAEFEVNLRDVRPDGFEPRQRPSFQHRYAESAVELGLAEAGLERVAKEVADCAERGDEAGLLQRATWARDLVESVHLCRRSVDRLLQVSGARQMFADRPMQAVFRDLQAIAGHFSCDRDRALGNYARIALGLDVGDEVI